jgi:hypothetical protein
MRLNRSSDGKWTEVLNKEKSLTGFLGQLAVTYWMWAGSIRTNFSCASLFTYHVNAPTTPNSDCLQHQEFRWYFVTLILSTFVVGYLKKSPAFHVELTGSNIGRGIGYPGGLHVVTLSLGRPLTAQSTAIKYALLLPRFHSSLPMIVFVPQSTLRNVSSTNSTATCHKNQRIPSCCRVTVQNHT